MKDHNRSELEPDLAQTRQYLSVLDPDPAAQFGFRTCDDRGGDPRLAVKTYGTLSRGLRQSSNAAKDGKTCQPVSLLTYMQKLGSGVFVVVNQLDGGGQRKTNVIGIRALFADCDSALAVERAQRFISSTGLAPTMIIASGGICDDLDKLHLYWRVNGCPVADFTAAQLLIASRIGSDPAVKDVGRVMRLPGFYHQKYGHRMTRIVSIGGVSYGLADFVARASSFPVAPGVASQSNRLAGGLRFGTGRSGNAAGTTARLRLLLHQNGGLIVPSVRALICEAHGPTEAGGGNRHPTMISAVTRCVQRGWRDDGIRKLILPAAAASWSDVDPQELSQRLESILHWVRQQEIANHAVEQVSSPEVQRLVVAFGGQAGAQ